MAEYRFQFPIWRDQKLSINVSSARFTVFSETSFDEVVGTVDAFAKPGKNHVELVLNSMLADCLKTEFPDVSKLDVSQHAIQLPDYYRSFIILAGRDQYILRATNDYSYDDKMSVGAVPWTLIRHELDIRMPLVIHCVADYASESNMEVRALFGNGAASPSRQVQMPVNETSGTVSFVLYGKADEIFGAKNNVHVSEIQILSAVGNSVDYPHIKVLNTGLKYALYYVDAYGYWRWLAVAGRVKQSESYQRQTFKSSNDNSDTSDRGTINYLNSITRTYEFSTGWLSDGQAALMHHLLGSVNVMLYDMEDESFTPVVITDSSCEYKTYKGEGCGPVTYTVTAQVAKDFVRK